MAPPILPRDGEGTIFDQSAGFTFVLGDTSLVESQNQGIEGTRLSGLRRVVIPLELSLGLTPRPGIPAYSTLIYEIELLSVG